MILEETFHITGPRRLPRYVLINIARDRRQNKGKHAWAPVAWTWNHHTGFRCGQFTKASYKFGPNPRWVGGNRVHLLTTSATSHGRRHKFMKESEIFESVCRSVVSDSLQPHGPQHTRPPCPSPPPGACSNSCPSSR